MKNTTFVSAGAGSGKTYRLTQDIAKMIKEGKCRSEEIILTTFTELAAKDLREKVRSALYGHGLYDAAMNIDNAAIGTIHSIAYQMVSRYWYLLGISANVSIMPDEDSKFYISQSLASLPTEEDLWLFDSICRSFNLTLERSSQYDWDFWKRELKGIIDKTVELCITEPQLEAAKEKSKELVGDVMGFSALYDIDKERIVRLTALAEDLLGEEKLAKLVRSELERLLPAIKNYNGGSNMPIALILKLADTIAGITTPNIKENYRVEIGFAAELAEQIPHSAQVKKLTDSYIDTVFRLATEWKKKYELFKQERCLLDFGDLLQKFDELLGKDEVVADIRSRYKVAFVDEFQDCSPLQVKSFERLSELMRQSEWVGDIKQAIYGFRGTNTELIKTIIAEVGKGNDGNQLDGLRECWRSNKTILDLVNHVFCEKVFKGQIEDKYIRLGLPVRKATDPAQPKEQMLRHLHFIKGKKENMPEELVDQVGKIIRNGKYKASEIAILYKKNSEVEECVKALRKKGIPYNARTDSNSDDASANEVSSFINAVVSFAARSDNQLSKAIIANFIEDGYCASKIISDRLRYVEQTESKEGWLAGLNVFERFSQIRNAIGNQSVSAAIETIVVELNLSDLLKRIEPSIPAYNYCSSLQAKASAYENMCYNLGLSSTLVGFVEYLKAHPIDFPGDDNGVSVMTYHKSKGLEWPCVILCSLNKEPVDPKRTFFGVQTLNTSNETFLRLVPSGLNSVCKGIMGKFEDHDFFKGLRCASVDEAKRLMYVGMTRPKEQLILTTYGKKNGDLWLTTIGCETIDSHTNAQTIQWGGAVWNHSVCNYTDLEEKPETVSATAAEFKVLKQPKERTVFEEKMISPSKAKALDGCYDATLCANFAGRLSISSSDDCDATIGNFIHHTMCLWNGETCVLEPLTKEYGINADADSVANSITNFWDWMEQTYGKPTKIEREVPFCFVNDNGQVVTGEIDLVYSTAEGVVLLDYKTYQGASSNLTDKNSGFYAGKYGGQIALYEEALKRKGCTVRDRLICYMSLGIVMRLIPVISEKTL